MYVLVDLGFVNCTFQESPKPGPDQARKSLRNQSAFFVDVFAICISRAEPSEQVRGQLGAAIQGQRTPYSPIDAPPEQ
eukprot:symbB.v1.2.024292.t1/scaffold2288.1/size83326/10